MDFTFLRIPPVIRIDIPALSEFVAFLREERKLDTLSTDLNQSASELEATTKEK